MALSVCGTTTNQSDRELTEHGGVLFPLACYEEDPETDPVPWHWHEEFEFILSVRGSIVVCLENQELTLSCGEAIFINSGMLHCVIPKTPEGGLLRSLVFHARLVGGSMGSIFWHKLIQPFLQDSSFRALYLNGEEPWQRGVTDAMHTAWQAVRDENEDYENLARYQISRALSLINRNRPVSTRVSSPQEQLSTERMKQMLQYIDEHFADELTVAMIADCASVSESVCLRCFRQVIRMTPMQYVKKLRIEKAAELLLTTGRRAGEIGVECGFSDISYFTKSFRQQKGCTPLAYRNTFS